MIDANSTFIAGVGHERSRSGIGSGIGAAANGFVSPMATKSNFGQLNLFHSTLTSNLANGGHPLTMKNAQLRNRNNNSNLAGHTGNSNFASHHNQSSKASLHDLNLTNTGGFVGYSPGGPRHQVNKHGGKLNGSGSSIKIPTITMHNQSFLKAQISPRGSSNAHHQLTQG